MFYNKLINLTRNKQFYENLPEKDIFSDRLIIFFIHFAFFLKEFKNKDNEKILQEIYDFNFRQLELSIREIGYGDQSINKKMKQYINTFHSIISDLHFWDDLDNEQKKNKISAYLDKMYKSDFLVEYFEKFRQNLSKKTLNSYLKSVSNP